MAHTARTRLVTLALATGTLAAFAAPAGAATTSSTTSTLVAKASGASVEIRLGIPATVASTLGLPTTLVQKISFTDGNVSTSDLASVAAIARLGQGNIPGVSSVLDKTATSTLSSPTASSSLVGLDAPAGLPVSAHAGDIASLVSSPMASTTGTLSSGRSELASLRVGNLIQVPSLKSDVVNPVVSSVSSTLDTTKGTVGTAIDTATKTLTDIASGVTKQTPAGDTVTPTVQQAAGTVATTLKTTLSQLDNLTALLSSLSAKGTDTLRLDTLLSSHEVTRSGTAVTSRATSSLADLDVLGGLVKVEGLQSVASATAGGTPGTASTDVTKPVLHVKVADALDAVLDQQGVHLTGQLGSVSAPLQPVVNGALNQVSGLLTDLAGVSVSYGEVTRTADGAGRYAVADVPGVTLTIDPPILHGRIAGQALPAKVLGDDQKLLQVVLVPAHAEVATVKTTKVLTTPRVAPPAVGTPAKKLPFTGLDDGVLVGLAVSLLAVAALLRRRFGRSEL